MLTSIGRLTLLALLASLTLTGCGSVAKLLRPDAGNVTAEPAAVTTMSPPAVVDTPAPPASTDRAAGPDTGPVPAAEEGTSAPGNSPAALAEQLTDEPRPEPADSDPRGLWPDAGQVGHQAGAVPRPAAAPAHDRPRRGRPGRRRRHQSDDLLRRALLLGRFRPQGWRHGERPGDEHRPLRGFRGERR